MRKKNPVVAAVLGFILGPLGFLYIGWRYALLALAATLVFAFIITVVDFPKPPWMQYVFLALFAWKGFAIVSVRNALIDSEDEHARELDRFAFAAMAMSVLLVGMGMFYAGLLGLYTAAHLILDGNVLRGALVLFIGTPALVWVSSLVFGFVAMGVDAVFASSMENLYRK